MNTGPIKVLLIDDDKSCFVLIRALLSVSSTPFEVEWADSYEEGLRAIESNSHHVCLVDYKLGMHTGVDLLRHAHQIDYQAPMIMLTGYSDRAIDIEAMSSGAADYLVKGKYDAPLLERSLRYAMERRRNQLALARREEHFRLLIENALDIIMVVATDGRISYGSPSIGTVLGIDRDEVIDRGLFEMMHPDDVDVARAIFDRRTEASENVWRFVFRLRHAVGEWRYFEAICRDRSDDPHVGGIVLNARDVTERIAAELQLKLQHDQLEQRVRERTAEIAEVMTQLEAAHAAQKRFVADISHDLRTPLTVVRAEIELLLGNAQFDEQTRYSLLRVKNEALRLDRLASDLLDLATLDAHETAEDFAPARLDELLFECLSNLNALARQKEISWNIQVEDELEIPCNAPALQRAITNVLENAIKYSHEAGVVSVTIGRDAGMAVIDIADTGHGIPQEDLPRVFDRFYRSDLTRNTPGTGLGLAIVKAVADTHGGTVTIDSNQGVGTKVTISLPESRTEDGERRTEEKQR